MPGFETTEWSLIYTGWDPPQQPLREALCALGNGIFVTRGAAEESSAAGPHYPGTYLAAGYNRLQSEVAGRVIENEDLVNWPNWLWLNFRPEDGAWFDLDAVEVLEFRQELDVRRGVLERSVRFRDSHDRETTLQSRRIVCMHQPHLAAIEWTLTAENWSGRIELDSGLDGSVTNSGVERYRALRGQHLDVLETGRVQEDGIYLVARSNQSRLRMAQAARTRVFVGDEMAASDRITQEEGNRISQRLSLACEPLRPIRVEKIVAISTSRDFALSEPSLNVRKLIARAETFEVLFARHALDWSHLWDRCDLHLQDGRRTQFVLRFHIFHLLQTASKHTADRDVGIPARGWHGEAYRGHVFWDELFVFPFFNLRLPELTRELLMYRYRRLDEARHAATEAGCRGAMFPWQSGSDGREESQILHLNPRSGRWVPDETRLQRHVGAAIAYNVWQYYEGTGDREFLESYGGEMILEIARFWASLAVLNAERGRYEIHGVVGPDEFHTRSPDSDQPGLRNNAYTNLMAAWVLRCASCCLEVLGEARRQELLGDLAVSDAELAMWDEISRRMYVPFHGDGIISQFEGYEVLEELDWDRYRRTYGDIHRLDRILEAEGDTINRYQVSKQADVLMLFFLFSAEQLAQLFERLEYPFDPEMIPANVDYYTQRTSHGSTLSRVVDAWVLSRSERERSWNLFRDALESDIADIQGGTTAEGIHLGAMAGTVDLMQRCYTGIETRDDVLWLNPRLPAELRGLRFSIRYRGHWLLLDIDHRRLAITCERGWAGPANIGVGADLRKIHEGERLTFDLAEA
ncbi:MAG: glycoside hydrolase family 65 protein [Planctomycetes bacterium]|nr:glycoside hydrolase family 65 protein [Planctomycetota bacterium]